MPTFGEFETVGDPIATGEERSHASTVWRAVKPAANDGREYAVKCYAPSLRAVSRSFETETLSRDRGLEFLDGIKDQRRAQAAGGRSLAPIYEFGIGDAGAWYVTDYYPRANLKAWIAKKGRVDSAGLRHVVSQLVAGCLALRHTRGYSHGNLKVSNAFRAGHKGTFRQTPILLTDPFPAGPARELDMPNTELLGNVMEAEDLRAIGEIVLQLVEGRLLANNEDYNWPIAPSPEWSKLGKDGERWLQLCNQLLDGNRSPAALNLDILAAKYPPSVGSGKTLLALATAVVAVCILGGGFYAIKAGSAKRNLGRYNADFQAAKLAHSSTNLNEALAKVNAALARQPDSQEARSLKGEIDASIEREFASAIQSADAKLEAYTPESLDTAERFLKAAEELKRQDQRASDLRGRIATLRRKLETDAARKSVEEALATYLKNGDDEARAATPNWLQASNHYALAVTNAAQLGDDNKRQIAEKGLSRAVSAIEAQTGEERLRNEVGSLISRAEAAERTNSWQTAVDLWTEAETKAKGLTKDPISVATQLASARRSLAGWQGKQADRRTIEDLVRQGDAGANATNWLSASNYFAQALTNAVRIGDPQLQQSARDKLQIAQQKIVEQENQKLVLQSQAKEQSAYKEATEALESGSFSNAQRIASSFTSPHFKTLTARIKDEEARWKAMTNHLAQARYDEIINATDLPASQMFSGIKTVAGKEKRILDDATSEFQGGTTTRTFRFLSVAEFNKLTNKPAFSNLVAEARKELDQGQKASELLGATNLAALRDYLNNEVKSKASKEPFKGYAARANTLEADLKKAETESAELARQAEVKYSELIKAGDMLLNEGKFAEAKAKADEALKYPNVRDRTAADSLVKRANSAFTQAEDLKSAQRALDAGEYATVASLRANYPAEAKFAEIAKRAEAESTALETYKKSFEAGDYRFIGELQGKAEYTAKKPFADLLRDAKEEANLFAELQSLKSATNWSTVLSRFEAMPASPAVRKPPFTEIKAWADGVKKAETERQASQLRTLDNDLEKMLVWFNVLRARDTQSAKQESSLGAIGNAKASYGAKAVYLETQYPASWLDEPAWRSGKTRRSLLVQLKSSITRWD